MATLAREGAGTALAHTHRCQTRMLASTCAIAGTLWRHHSCSPVGAVQTKGGGELRQYEVMLILPPDADESVIGGAVDRIVKVVSQSGGEVGKIDRWGRRRLAYEIAHQSEGFYVVVEFKADPSTIAEVERMLGLADEVLRFKVIVRAA